MSQQGAWKIVHINFKFFQLFLTLQLPPVLHKKNPDPTNSTFEQIEV